MLKEAFIFVLVLDIVLLFMVWVLTKLWNQIVKGGARMELIVGGSHRLLLFGICITISNAAAIATFLIFWGKIR